MAGSLDASVDLARIMRDLSRCLDELAGIDFAEVHACGVGDACLTMVTSAQRLQACAAVALDRFESSGAWADDAARSGPAWVSARTPLPVGAVRAQRDAGRLLRAFPHVQGAWQAGAVTGRHVDVLGDVMSAFPRLAGALVDADEAITRLAVSCPARRFGQKLLELCHRWDPVAVQEDENDRRTSAYLSVSRTLDGYVKVDGLLDPELGEKLIASLEQALRDVERTGEKPQDPFEDLSSGFTPDNRFGRVRNLEGLHRLLDAAAAVTDPQGLPAVPGARPLVTVNVQVEDLVREIDCPGVAMGWLMSRGVPETALSAAAVREIACDSTIRPLVVDARGHLVALLPKSRAVPPAMRRAILMRDIRCRFPGCGRRIDHVHHIQFWSNGGVTRMDNLVGLCWHHHHEVHRDRLTIDGDPESRLRFTGRLGREWLSDPPDD